MRFIAVFLSVLIVSLPFYSAIVFAQQVSIRTISAKGSDGIDGFIREQDFMEFEVEVLISGDSQVTNEQVWMGTQDTFNCQPGLSQYTECTYRSPTSGTDRLSNDEFYAVVIRNDDGNQIGNPIIGHVYRDEEGAQVGRFQITPTPPATTGDGSVDIFFEVTDSAYSGCTGIKRVEIYEDDLDNIEVRAPAATIDVDGDPNDCSYSDTITYTTAQTSGTVRLCMVAFDNFNQCDLDDNDDCKGICRDFDVDRVVPAIDTASFNITDDEGNLVASASEPGYYKGPRSITVSIEVSDEYLDVYSVKADFSELNPGAIGYGDKQADCDEIDAQTHTYRCVWPNINLNPDSSGTKSIIINASDTSDPANTNTKIISKTFEEDTTGPVVANIITSLYDPDEGKSYANASGTRFIAEITEAGAGLDSEDVTLNVAGYTGDAKNCTKTGADSWFCIWDDVYAPGQNGRKDVSVSGEDILGNPIQSDDFNVTFDTIAPENITIEITSDNPAGKVTSGDTLLIIAEGIDKNYVSAYANISGYIDGRDEAAVGCYKNSTTDEFTCVWQGTIDQDGGYEVTSTFTFEDIVGNKAKKTATEVLYQREEAIQPDFFYFDEAYFEEQLKGLPIESQTITEGNLPGQLYYQIIPFKLRLNTSKVDPAVDELEVENIRMYNCQGYASYAKVGDDYHGFFQFALDVNQIYNEIDAGNDYITLGVDRVCTVEFDVALNKKTYIYPESEPLMLNIPIIESFIPGQDVDAEALEDAIEDIKSEVTSEFYDLIEDLDTYMLWLKNICDTRKIFGTIMQFAAILGTVASSKCNPMLQTGGPAWCRVKITTSQLMSGWFITWETSQWGKWVKLACDLNNCQGTGKAGEEKDDGDDEPSEPGDVGDEAIGRRKSYCDYMKNGFIKFFDGEGWKEGDLKDLFEDDDTGGEATEEFFRNAFGQSTLSVAKRSLWFSIVCLCVPGIIYNIRKWRELKCWKGTCYRDMVPLGIPKDECDKQYNYQKCVYLGGEFLVMTGLQIIDSIISSAVSLFLNPLAAGWELMKLHFYETCRLALAQAKTKGPNPTETSQWIKGCQMYAFMQLATSFAEIYQFTETMTEMEWEHETNTCGQFLEGEEDVTSE